MFDESQLPHPKRLHLLTYRSGAATSKAYQGMKAVVVGAGPAGACAAMFLAEQGFNVEVSLCVRIAVCTLCPS